MKRVVIPATAAVCTLAGYVGVTAGKIPTETEIINHYAAEYVAAYGATAKPTDCLARAGTPPVRLTVICTHIDGRQAVYPAGRRGELVEPVTGAEA